MLDYLADILHWADYSMLCLLQGETQQKVLDHFKVEKSGLANGWIYLFCVDYFHE